MPIKTMKPIRVKPIKSKIPKLTVPKAGNIRVRGRAIRPAQFKNPKK